MRTNTQIRRTNLASRRDYRESLAVVLLVLTWVTGANGAVIGIEGSHFMLDGKPAFLLGASYYGALGAREEFVRQDLDDLQRHGFNWLRIWATWEGFGEDVSAVDSDGRSRQPYLERLQWLVAECDRRGLVVDVTMARGRGAGRLPNQESHLRAVEALSVALKQHRNWFLDLANERDVRDDRYVSIEELRTLRDALRRIDPLRLVTASCGGHDLSESDLHDALVTAELDFVSPHRPRHPQSPAETLSKTRECLNTMKEAGRVAPILYQEPFRRGYASWQPMADDFLADLSGAVSGGAAGWCLHNGSQRDSAGEMPRRSFDLRARRLLDQLDSEERTVLEGAATILRQPSSP